MILRKALFAYGFRFRLHDKKLPGKPDIVLKKYKTVIFVHGCFWHGHDDCKYFVVPKTRREWWLKKIRRNKELDLINTGKIKRMKWKVINIHECNLKGERLNRSLKKLFNQLDKEPG
jgi:DNA mismatch endonuclease (patch repair protein)